MTYNNWYEDDNEEGKRVQGVVTGIVTVKGKREYWIKWDHHTKANYSYPANDFFVIGK